MNTLFILLCFFSALPDGLMNRIPKMVFYELEAKGNPHNPQDWTMAERHNCPGSESISAIAIFHGDVYTLTEAIEAGNQAWEGKPKVNQSGIGIINEMKEASVSPLDPYQALSGRTYFKGSK